MKPKIGILSLGCPRNIVDSESISGRLFKKGYKIVDIDKASIAIVNTCSFIRDAKDESIEAILDLISLKKEGRIRKIIVYGCLSQRYKSLLARELPEIDAFVGSINLNAGGERFKITPGHYAYLKICESCINLCSFCIIPKIKGKFQSLPVDSILKKVDKFSREGLSELNIIGQDITGFGRDMAGKTDLSWLLKKIVSKAKKIEWIRLLYLNPLRVNDELLGVIGGERKICKYIDLPIQHINDRILGLMGRGIKRRELEDLIARIRRKIPGVLIRTSVIVGFPGETKSEFDELLEFIKDYRFERLGAFKYSREEGTRAYNFKGQVSAKEKEERFNRVMDTQRSVSSRVNQSFMGKSIRVLIDEVNAKDCLIGRSEFDAPEVDGTVYVKAKRKYSPGDFVTVNIIDTLEYDLVGQEA